ncbi:RmlC-like cupin domain-containing protein [Podospora australis]|uniref:RmlC-like cupin domain-containing protein n=1 Tax=Podospora australis TaxID=1536484 RepID=A0AAN7AKD2_9PEZI|nr:RmlC-like cupin domain-containing protein [Podospora australis]
MKNFFSLIIAFIVGIAAILLGLSYYPTQIHDFATTKLNVDINHYINHFPALLNFFPNLNTTTLTSSTSAPPVFVISTATMASTARIIPRAIRKAFLAVEQSEGAGARVRRSIGTPSLKNLTPFLMLDHFSVKPGAGFPDHPHRGQETITYLLEGGMDHEDFAGNRGTLNPGDLQFMTAGKGIMHAEMPRQNEDGSANVGLQLWVDLPKELKMCEPRYRDLRAAEIPEVVTEDGKVKIKVISGKSHGVDSVKDLAYTPVVFYDITIQPGGKVQQELPSGFSSFAYTLEGEVVFETGTESKVVKQFHNVVFEKEGDGIIARVADEAEKPARFVLIGGQPMDGQAVVQYGPFVVTSQEEVYQAFVDYQSHSNGFERARGWRSEIGKSMVH